MDLQKNELTSNDPSEIGFNHVAKLVKASGATALDMSKLIDQYKNNQNKLEEILTNAFNGTKDMNIELVDLGEKQAFINSLKSQAKFKP